MNSNSSNPVKFTSSRQSELEQDFLAQIYGIGFYPFVLIRVGQNSVSRSFVFCQTQNEMKDFLRALAGVSSFSKSLLVRGIAFAVQGEIYEASELIYRWATSMGDINETALVCRPDGKLVEKLYNYPVFALDCGSATPPPGEQRLSLLTDVLQTYESNDGNNARRFLIIEALALALGRALGGIGRHKDALAIIEKALAARPESMSLHAAKNALQRKLDGRDDSLLLGRFAGDGDYLRQFNVDMELVERFSQTWDAHAYQESLADLRNAARRLLPVLLGSSGAMPALNSREKQRLLQLEKQVTCLARQPLCFPEMFHGVALLRDGSSQKLDPGNEIHFRANGLLGVEDRGAVAQIYERISKQARSPLRVVEIGSAAGRGSTQIAGEFVKRSGGILYCIDPWVGPLYYAFLANVQIFDLESTVIPIRSPSVEAAVLFEDGSLDAVFVDGSHIYPDVLADINAYLPKIRKDGFIFGHDLYDLPSRFDRKELLSISKVNNAMAHYRNSEGAIELVNVHPGVVLAVQDRFGDDVEHFTGSVVWAKQV
jgi:tetratricopeptide (TPR) repeat protein